VAVLPGTDQYSFQNRPLGTDIIIHCAHPDASGDPGCAQVPVVAERAMVSSQDANATFAAAIARNAIVHP
jgi:hypothetical protein